MAQSPLAERIGLWRGVFYSMVLDAGRCGAQCSALCPEGKPQSELWLPANVNPARVCDRSRYDDGARVIVYRCRPMFG